ncbi:MAG: hypothetical protein WCK62_00820 [Actinomycetes bacterium]
MKNPHRPLLVLIPVLSLALSGCGAPSQIYAADKKDGVYLTLPNGWHSVSQQKLNSLEATSTVTGATERLSLVRWQEGFSPDAKIGAKAVLSLSAPSSPVIYVRVRGLTFDETNAVSFNSLRNMIVPLTTWIDGSDTSAPEFQIFDDTPIVQKIARGVHTNYEFTVKGQPSQTIDQTALVSDDRSSIFVLIVRCTTTCFEKNRDLLSKISKSFTVRGTR